MRSPRALARLSLALVVVGAVAGGLACHKKPGAVPPPPAHPPHPACVMDPARCERLCQGCDDHDDCFYRGGECLRRQGAVLFKRDEGDGGDDVFHGGCHYEGTDPACGGKETFLAGDACLGDARIAEWTQSRCHDSCLSVYDCAVACRRRGQRGGVCKTLPDRCGAGRDSAACVCD